MGKQSKYQLLRSEYGRKGMRVLREVPVQDIRRVLGLSATQGMTRSQWLDYVGAEVDKARHRTFDASGRIIMWSVWAREGMVRDTMRAADWLYQERAATRQLLASMGWERAEL